ncbi:hypothetical protein [Acidithiobacillus sp. AMEEHan]|uniref:hypothetical protein n=1 Tax=Acidithiobacillus sp. AMEEHan TaxID=2994951 RepID=UPI0035B48608
MSTEAVQATIAAILAGRFPFPFESVLPQPQAIRATGDAFRLSEIVVVNWKLGALDFSPIPRFMIKLTLPAIGQATAKAASNLTYFCLTVSLVPTNCDYLGRGHTARFLADMLFELYHNDRFVNRLDLDRPDPLTGRVQEAICIAAVTDQRDAAAWRSVQKVASCLVLQMKVDGRGVCYVFVTVLGKSSYYIDSQKYVRVTGELSRAIDPSARVG